MIQQVAKDVYQIAVLPRNAMNCYIAEGVLVDSGVKTSYELIAKYLRKIPVHLHIITHAHADHQGSSDRICNKFNLPLYCHENEVYRTETGLATKDYPSQGILTILQQEFWAGPGHKVNKTIKENDSIGNFRVIETPGHSAGHIALFREKDGVLILGDIAANMNFLTTLVGLHLPSDLFTTDQQENIASLQKVAALHPKIICFGHGPVLKNRNHEFERFVEKCAKDSGKT
jgi:glyoxylase-like metal-dependent hydrolase (beta-lactamase superfamily II)